MKGEKNLNRHKKAVRLFLILSTLAFSTAAIAGAAEFSDSLVPMGEVVGISVRTGGVMIAELSEIDTADGTVCPARDAGLEPGDVIIKADGKTVRSAADLTSVLSASRAESISIQFTRGSETMQRTVSPYRTGSDAFIGVWVRDSLTGIGTVTFYDPESGVFGALGHSISDSETGEALPFDTGTIHPAGVTGIVPGKAGAPGQLGGTLDLNVIKGEMITNSPVGIFGYLDDDAGSASLASMPVADRSEIKTGVATILSAADGTVKEYDIEITRIYPSSTDGRSMMLRVTDDKLLALTGGIVQGMSGSPILQNGKLVGAVTHVLINDPTKGYGVSITEMLDQCENLRIFENKAA